MSSNISIGSNTYTLITIPSTPGVSSYDLTMNDTVAVVSSPYVPSQTQTITWPGADGWALTFTLPKMNRWTAAPWFGFLAELRGMQNVFQFGDPLYTIPYGQADGSPVCSNTYSNNSVTSTTLGTSGWTPNVFGQLLPGDYIQVDKRLYQVCEQTNSDSSGYANIVIWPSLRDSPNNGNGIVLSNTTGVFRLAQNQRTRHADYTRLTQISIKAVEVR
jgi:hypothetical protein